MYISQTDKKTYYYILNEIKYGIYYVCSGKSISIEITNLLNPLFESYQAKFATEEIEKISVLFTMIKTTEQYDKIFERIFSSQQFSLIKNQKEITIKIAINLEIFGEVNFELIIPKVQIDNEKKLDYLLNKFITQEKKINELDDKVKKQEKIIESLKKNNNDLTEKVIKLEEYIKKKEPNELFEGDNSKIVESEEEKEFLKEILPNKKFKLLYRATKDGDSYENFHSKVDNKGETITLFKTDKNRKFGGHISKSWKNSGDWQNGDPSYFLFSFDEKKCYKDKKNSLYSGMQFYCNKDWGPDFYGGSGVLCIYENGSLLGKGSGYEEQKFTLLSNITKDYEFSGEHRFTCIEVEVYKVIN